MTPTVLSAGQVYVLLIAIPVWLVAEARAVQQSLTIYTSFSSGMFAAEFLKTR